MSKLFKNATYITFPKEIVKLADTLTDAQYDMLGKWVYGDSEKFDYQKFSELGNK